MAERTRKNASSCTKVRLILKGPGDFKMDMNAECGETVAFGLYMLVLGDSTGPGAVALNAARRAYLEAAAEYQAARQGVQP